MISTCRSLFPDPTTQDIGYGNILSNFRGGAKFPADYTRGEPYPFRSHFPVRYYLNDFEMGLSFDANSNPSSRLITGIPYTASGRPGTYGRPIAPEMKKSDVPYCPFRADVWQLGTLMKSEDCEFEVCPTSFRDHDRRWSLYLLVNAWLCLMLAERRRVARVSESAG